MEEIRTNAQALRSVLCPTVLVRLDLKDVETACASTVFPILMIGEDFYPHRAMLLSSGHNIAGRIFD
jgi:hypothetical protein